MKRLSLTPFFLLVVVPVMISIYSCGLITQLKQTTIPIGTSFQKIDSILGKTQGKKIQDITKLAAEGFVSGINLDSIRVSNLLDSMLHHLGPLLNTQLSQVELNDLQFKISNLLDKVTKDDKIASNIDHLLSQIIASIQHQKIKINIDPNVNTQNVMHSLDTLLVHITQDNNADRLAALLNQTLLRVAQGDGLDSLILKVTKPIEKIDKVSTGWKKNIKLLIGGLAGLIVLGAAAYAWRKRSQYKSLSSLLTKNIDKIDNQQEYDSVVKNIKSEAEQYKLNDVLDDLIKENQNQYQVKAQYKNKTNNALKVIGNILQDEPMIKNKLLKATEHDRELNTFIKDNITKA